MGRFRSILSRGLSRVRNGIRRVVNRLRGRRQRANNMTNRGNATIRTSTPY